MLKTSLQRDKDKRHLGRVLGEELSKSLEVTTHHPSRAHM